MAQNQNFSQTQKQSQKQQQTFKMSQLQIQAVKFLELGTDDLRAEIYKFAAENPAVEIVGDSEKYGSEKRKSSSLQDDFRTSIHTTSSGIDQANAYQRAMENQEDDFETLQSHLMHQLNSINIPWDEYELSQKLIYNLDKNGCYGSLLSPETLLDKSRPLQNKAMLDRCIERIQKMDPVGTCCRTLEESLYVQAKIAGDASPLTLFLLKDHLEFLSPPQPDKVLKKVLDFRRDWHKKAFATPLLIDDISIGEKDVESSINYILHLNPRPAQGYSTDTTARYEMPDIVLSVEKKEGYMEDDFLQGVISCDEKNHFQVKYASGVLPELRISQDFLFDKESVDAAKAFINNLHFRESTIVLQGCAIVKAQREFFSKGPGNLAALTRRQIAEELGVHESTVSRFANKKNSKYIQTEWGLYPASYFFSSGVKSSDGKTKISAEEIKIKMQEIINQHAEGTDPLTDLKLAQILQTQGINIARRTVAKYREQLGLGNSYKR